MAKVIIFKSAFDNKCDIYNVEAGFRVMDYEQTQSVDFKNALVYVNGFEKDENYILRHDDVCTVRMFPDGVTAAVVATIVAVGVAVAVTDAVLTTTTGKGLVEWGKIGLRKMISSLLEDSSTASNGQESVTSIPVLSGAKNQNQNGKAYPFVMGRHLYTPCYIGGTAKTQGYHEIGGTDGDESTFHGLYMLGYNNITANNFCLGMVDLASNSGNVESGTITCDGKFSDNDPHLEIQQGNAEVSLYPQKVSEESIGSELTCIEVNNALVSFKAQRFSASYPQKVQLEFYFQGLISYDSSGNEGYAEVQIKSEYSLDGGTTFVPFPYKIGAGQTVSSTADIQYNSTTGVTTIRYKLAKEIRLLQNLELPYSSVKNCTNHVIEFRIQRVNAQSTDSNTADRVALSAIRTWCYDPEKSKSENDYVAQQPIVERDKIRTARLGLTMKGTERLSGQADELNCIVTSKGRTCTYDQSTDTYTWTTLNDFEHYSETQNPASIALLLLQSSMRGNNAYTDSRIDLYSFGQFYMWCERNGYKCNGVLTSQKKTSELLKQILFVGRGALVLHGTKYGVLIDNERTTPTLILNNQNVLSASNRKSFEKLPDGYRCTFVNEDNGYTEDEMVVLYDMTQYDDYMAGNVDLTLESVTVPFITNPSQLFKQLRYQLACRKLRPEIWSRKVTTEGNLIEIGDLIEIQDDTILVGIGDGAEVISLVFDDDDNPSYITGIKTDGKFPVTDLTKTYGVKIVQADGISEPVVVKKQVTIASVGMQRNFVFAEPISLNEAVLPTVGDIVSFGVFDRITIDAICFGKKDNGDGTFDLTLIPYDENVYNADTGTIPEFNSKVTPPMDAGEVASEYATSLELMTARAEQSGAVNTLINGTADIGNPDNVTGVSAVATESGVIVSWNPIGSGLKNSLKEYVIAFYDGTDGAEWIESYAKTQDNTYTREFSSTEFFEASDLSKWKFKVKAVNLYGKSSLLWSSSTGTSVVTTGYGTWNVGTPRVVGSVRNRMLMLNISTAENLKVYGNVKAHIQIQRQRVVLDETTDPVTAVPSDYPNWYAPDASDPYGSNENYRGTLGGNLEYDLGTYTLTVPLYGQDANPIKMYNTPYKFNVWLSNEKGADTGHAVEVTLTADITGIKDLVQSNLTQKEAVVQNLAALSARMGSVSAAEIASDSEADGSLKPSGSQFYINGNVGHEEFYVGNKTKGLAEAYEDGSATEPTDDYEFLHFKPSTTQGQSGAFWFKLKNFILTTLASIVSGIFRVKASSATADANSFLTINPTGSADSVTGVPAQTMNVNGELTIDGHHVKKVYELDMWDADEWYYSWYYPVIIDIPEEATKEGYKLELTIATKREFNYSSSVKEGNSVLNLSFSVSGRGPFDYEVGMFEVKSFWKLGNLYNSFAVQVGAFAGNVIWLRGAMKYFVYSNYPLRAYKQGVTISNFGHEFYADAGASTNGSANTTIPVLWTMPQESNEGKDAIEVYKFGRRWFNNELTWNVVKQYSIIDRNLDGIANVALNAYPVGSIYMSVNSTSPRNLFGGKWEQISQGRVLLGAGSIQANTVSTYGTVTAGEINRTTAEERGGEVNHTLTTAQLPSHSHPLSGTGVTAKAASISKSGWFKYKGIEGVEADGTVVKKDTQNWGYGHSGTSGQKQGTMTFVLDHDHTLSGDTGTKGSDSAHNNMPPYLVVYMWKRLPD